MIAATLGLSEIVAGYIDQASEKMVAAYTRERENWLRNRSAERAARIRDLLSGERASLRRDAHEPPVTSAGAMIGSVPQPCRSASAIASRHRRRVLAKR